MFVLALIVDFLFIFLVSHTVGFLNSVKKQMVIKKTPFMCSSQSTNDQSAVVCEVTDT